MSSKLTLLGKGKVSMVMDVMSSDVGWHKPRSCRGGRFPFYPSSSAFAGVYVREYRAESGIVPSSG